MRFVGLNNTAIPSISNASHERKCARFHGGRLDDPLSVLTILSHCYNKEDKKYLKKDIPKLPCDL